MLVVFSPTFVVDTKTVFSNNFGAPLRILILGNKKILR